MVGSLRDLIIAVDPNAIISAVNPGSWHPVSSSASAAVPAIIHARALMADSSFPPLLLVVPGQSYRMPTPTGTPAGSRGNCAGHRENPADSPRPAYTHIR